MAEHIGRFLDTGMFVEELEALQLLQVCFEQSLARPRFLAAGVGGRCDQEIGGCLQQALWRVMAADQCAP